MLVQTHFPRSLSRSRYDQYLASGWFRGSVMLYKMDLLCIDESLFSVVNIRMNLDQHSWSSRHKKIMRRVEKRFAVTYGHAQPNANKEAPRERQRCAWSVCEKWTKQEETGQQCSRWGRCG